VIEHLGSLGALVVVGDDGLAVLDPATLDAVAVERSLDPLTPLWRVDHLPAGEPVGGPDDTASWRRDASVLGGALLVGLAAATVDLAVAYAKERQQFGKPIGSFQAVKHLCADMLVRAEVARAAVHAAAVTIDQPDVGDAVRPRPVPGCSPSRRPLRTASRASRCTGHGIHVGGAGASLSDAGPGARRRARGDRRAGRARRRALLIERSRRSRLKPTDRNATEGTKRDQRCRADAG